MTRKFYSYSSSSFYKNLNGKESFESIEVENNEGKIKSKYTSSKDGITTTKYYNNTLKNSRSAKNILSNKKEKANETEKKEKQNQSKATK